MYSISEFSKRVGMSQSTLRRMELSQRLIPESKTGGGHRRYSEDQLNSLLRSRNQSKPRINVGYSKVSSDHQIDSLMKEAGLVESALASKGVPYKLIQDIGFGQDKTRSGLLELIRMIAGSEVDTLIMLRRDRLSGYSNELLECFCQTCGTKIIYLHDESKPNLDEELEEDLLSVLSGYGCSRNNKKLELGRQIMSLIDEFQYEHGRWRG